MKVSMTSSGLRPAVSAGIAALAALALSCATTQQIAKSMHYGSAATMVTDAGISSSLDRMWASDTNTRDMGGSLTFGSISTARRQLLASSSMVGTVGVGVFLILFFA
jgi:hypothetical protein